MLTITLRLLLYGLHQNSLNCAHLLTKNVEPITVFKYNWQLCAINEIFINFYLAYFTQRFMRRHIVPWYIIQGLCCVTLTLVFKCKFTSESGEVFIILCINSSKYYTSSLVNCTQNIHCHPRKPTVSKVDFCESKDQQNRTGKQSREKNYLTKFLSDALKLQVAVKVSEHFYGIKLT